jgi:hypothetical protein
MFVHKNCCFVGDDRFDEGDVIGDDNGVDEVDNVLLSSVFIRVKVGEEFDEEDDRRPSTTLKSEPFE